MKNAFYKTVGNSFLNWSELQEVLLDIEVTLNSRPLGYQEDVNEMPTLTINSLQFVGATLLPELEVYREENLHLRKRAKYLRRCKHHKWKRWTTEYLGVLRERHNVTHDAKSSPLAVGDVVIITSDERSRGKWPLGEVEELFPGRDG